MYVDIHLQPSSSYYIGEVVDEKETAYKIRCLEPIDDSEHFSFRNPVWMAKGNVINSYSKTKTLEDLGYEEIGDNIYKFIDPTSDEDYLPSEEEDDDDEHLN